jgi:hypothetical protein
MATATGTISHFCNLVDRWESEGDQWRAGWRAAIKWTMPNETKGLVPTAARLKMYRPYRPSWSGEVTTTAKYSTGTWVSSSSWATVNGLATTNLSTLTLTDHAEATKTWDVLGTSTEGIWHACLNSLETCTLIVDSPRSNPPSYFDYHADDIYYSVNGTNFSLTRAIAGYNVIDQTFYGSTAPIPILEIDYGSAPSGSFAFFAGKVTA